MSGYTQKLRLIKLQVISLTENHVNLIFFDPLKKTHSTILNKELSFSLMAAV